MALGGGLLGRPAPGELEGRERPDKLGMSPADVALDLVQQRRLVLPPEKLSTSTSDGDRHPAVKTG